MHVLPERRGASDARVSKRLPNVKHNLGSNLTGEHERGQREREHRVALHELGSAPDAEDIAQDVCLMLVDKLRSTKTNGEFFNSMSTGKN